MHLLTNRPKCFQNSSVIERITFEKRKPRGAYFGD